MKKLISLCLTVIIVISLTACGSLTGSDDIPDNAEASLSVLCVNTDYSRNFIRTIQTRFPEVDLQIEYFAAANNTSEYIVRLLESGSGPDIVYTGTVFEEELQKEYLLDLSVYDFAGRYSVSIMNQRDVDGAIYLLPGTYSVFSMLYNKSLFKEKGWAVPTTNDELVALARRIREEEPGMIPVSHCGYAVGTYWRMLGSLAQSGFLGTPEGAEWTKAFVKGEESFETGFGSALQMLQQWKEAGMLDALDADSGNNDVFVQLMSRKAAMAYPVGGLADLKKVMAESDDEIGAFPFLGKDKNNTLLTLSTNFNFGLSKVLGEQGNEKRLEKALEIMDYLSSDEGQKKLVVQDTDVSPLGRKTPPAEGSPYTDVWEHIESGDVLPFLLTDYYDIWAECGAELKEVMLGNGSMEDIAPAMDKLHQDVLADQHSDKPLFTVAEDMTHPQTVQVMADLLHETGGDVAVVSDGTFINNVPNAMGVSGRLLAGTFNRVASYSINIPGAMNKHVMRLTLTGKELFALLEGGCGVTAKNETAVFDYYWSGMDAVIKDGKITSAALSDGREVQPDEKYQVTICGSDYDDEAYPDGEDTGVTVSEAYLKVMEGKTLTAPDKLCR